MATSEVVTGVRSQGPSAQIRHQPSFELHSEASMWMLPGSGIFSGWENSRSQ